MTTLVTGGTGWVPSHIVRRLARRGEPVVSFDLMAPDAMFHELLGEEGRLVTHVRGDITDAEALLNAALRHGVDRIIHAAVITPRIERERRESRRVIEVNLIGTVNALEAAIALPSLQRFVYVSSGAVWGDHSGLDTVDEETESRATSLYGITKHASERIGRRYGELHGFDWVAVRPPNVFGPMERVTPGYQGATELREMLRIHFDGNPVLVNSLAGPWLDWTYVEDVAEGVERVWAAPRERLAHDVYTLTAGRLHSIGEVLEAFARHLPGFRYLEVPADQANYVVSGGGPGPVASNRRLAEDLGYTPQTSFDDGMRQYLAWIQQHGPQ